MLGIFGLSDSSKSSSTISRCPPAAAACTTVRPSASASSALALAQRSRVASLHRDARSAPLLAMLSDQIYIIV